ncbi:MAG TPA: hypothetical protein P5038_20800 [Candidatus Paceibacterota bacterium]|nr:hypothetical protein [Candidatus Paceibacterota bacterium]HRT59073.1 hypothetical protein [Candidatus Paceibacterota bacterium]
MLEPGRWEPGPGVLFSRIAEQAEAEEWEARVPEDFSASSRFYRLKLALSP